MPNKSSVFPVGSAFVHRGGCLELARIRQFVPLGDSVSFPDSLGRTLCVCGDTRITEMDWVIPKTLRVSQN
jgi:hypothetical protein